MGACTKESGSKPAFLMWTPGSLGWGGEDWWEQASAGLGGAAWEGRGGSVQAASLGLLTPLHLQPRVPY